ncbi:Nif3-like dinuclear metal center hexameric protein [Thermosediminibacter litoriperuensis]|uniref:Nif3-like dinuclear metal center hexameric protein n=1 Tax=Thermosediminibacter litoriperuensis TaxID=291989 RepID=UPI001CA41EF2|nr:Nif3-like dinuclear metal center hexameric protein [Thermosediminibacter litoriperuensis]
MPACQTVINIIERLAPRKLALEWDNVGLMVGDYSAKVDRILVALTVTPGVMNYAIEHKMDMIISHHPFLFKPLKSIKRDLPSGRMIYDAVKHDIVIYSAHTNLDVASGGVNDLLAGCLDLEGVEVLEPTREEPLKKIVVFVPRGYEDAVRDAMGDAGAGHIGNYSHCTFNVAGIGTFRPLEKARPFIGEAGRLERVEEVRIETIAPESLVKKIVSAMLKAHPYEEVAYDLYPVENKGGVFGLGRIGYLKSPLTLKDLCENIKQKLGVNSLRVVGDLTKKVSKVAVCGGAGGNLVSKAAFLGADVYITGDVKYHEAEEARITGMALIDAGHYSTEKLILNFIADHLKKELSALGEDVCVEVYDEGEPFAIV